MDFIKTSSLRALIELTFQRNWNGLIWISRKGVITKRVKTAPDGSIEKAPSRASAGRGTNVPRLAIFKSIRPRLGQSPIHPAIVQHVGIAIPNYETLPKPIPLDLHALQQIHFLNRWTQNPTKF
ncbi:unnamed protein product, partial [Microthlaspi erraticum]